MVEARNSSCSIGKDDWIELMGTRNQFVGRVEDLWPISNLKNIWEVHLSPFLSLRRISDGTIHYDRASIGASIPETLCTALVLIDSSYELIQTDDGPGEKFHEYIGFFRGHYIRRCTTEEETFFKLHF